MASEDFLAGRFAAILGLSGCLITLQIMLNFPPTLNFVFAPLTALLAFLWGRFCCGNVGCIYNRLGPCSVAHIKCIEIIISGLGKPPISVPMTDVHLP